MGICGASANKPIEHGNATTTSPMPNSARQNQKPAFKLNDTVRFREGKITDFYHITDILGKGTFGEVRKAVNIKSGTERAVKILSRTNMTDHQLKKLTEEINILKLLDHPNILRVFESYMDEDHLYIVTEMCRGGELFDRICKMKKFGEQMAKDVMAQILSAIAYCHASSIVHRDLKPENVLYETADHWANLKVIDFGSSALFSPGNYQLTKKYGTVDLNLT